MRLAKLTLISILIFGVLFLAYIKTPKETRHEIEDWIARLHAMNFDLPPDDFYAQGQTELVGELQRRGYELTCFGSLQVEEKIDKSDDYLCWFVIKSAFDDIPARTVTLFFSKEKLSNAKLEFPASSFERLSSYLTSRLQAYPKSSSPRDVDIFGKPLKVWQTKSGVVITSEEPTKNKPITLLWSRY